MAEETNYSTSYGTDSLTNKRKYEDQSTPSSLSSGRRATGFSTPHSSKSPDSAAPPSYNNVPPPSSALDDIETAKQRAQEIAARLFNDGEAKRPKVDNGAAYDSNDSKPYSSSDVGQKPYLSAVSSMPAAYGGGHSGPSKKIEIPNGRVGVIIGKAGDTIKYLQLQSGARIQVTRDMDADPTSATRGVELMGTPEQISKAEQLIHDVLNEAETGTSSLISRRIGGQAGGTEHFTMKVPNNKVGLIIGKGGETIKTMQNSSGARIQVIPLHLPPGDNSLERTLEIDGTSEQIDAAKALVNEVITENRLRNQSMTGYSSQQGYQTRPPTSWAPPGQQQPGYGYVQPGAYPGQTPQYNMSQSQYPGYPPQPASGGYATGWDQNAGATNQQQTGQGGGYDYYNQQSAPQQQQPPGGASGADNTAYGYYQQGYTQQGQGYTQDGYGGYHASAQQGYGQPQPGYDQGYNSAAGYGSGIANPTPEGKTTSYGAQADGSQALSSTQPGYNTSQQPSPTNASYPPQGPTQPGYSVPPTSQPGYGSQPSAGYGPSYGAPQAQKPVAGQAAYGQPQQSPTAQGGYAQSAGYATQLASGYALPDSTTQRAPPSAYGTTPVSGYTLSAYGAAPVTQPGYGGQQPPAYNSSYGSGYSQPAAYSADGSTAPASQVAPPNGGVAKASPKS